MQISICRADSSDFRVEVKCGKLKNRVPLFRSPALQDGRKYSAFIAENLSILRRASARDHYNR